MKPPASESSACRPAISRTTRRERWRPAPQPVHETGDEDGEERVLGHRRGQHAADGRGREAARGQVESEGEGEIAEGEGPQGAAREEPPTVGGEPHCAFSPWDAGVAYR